MNHWLLFEMGINAYQAAMVIYFVRRRFHIVRTSLVYAWLAGALTWAALSLYLFVDIPITDAIVFLIPLAYALHVSDDSGLFVLFWIAALAIIFLGITTLMIQLFLLLFHSTWEQIMTESALRITFVVCLNIALLVAIFLMTRIGRRAPNMLSWMISGIFLFTLLVDLGIIELLYAALSYGVNGGKAGAFTAASLCILLSALLSLALYEIMSINAARQKRMEAELQQTRLQQNHYQEMKSIYTYMASYEHDMKHKLTVIQSLLMEGQREKGQELYDALIDEQEKRPRFITGSVAVDAVLTIKKLAMEKHSIQFSYQPYPLRELPIDESSFCVILSNLLDNAIEGVNRIEDSNCPRGIELKFARSWNVFFIVCENDMAALSIHRNGIRFLSSKKDELGHGFGVENIRRIVDEVNGQCKFVAQGNRFRVEIALPFDDDRQRSV